MTQLPPIERFDSSSGARIYRLPMMVFPNGFIGYAFIVLEAGSPVLIDTGSGFGQSTSDLLSGIDALSADFGEALKVTDIKRILITHGHIDHFGGLAHMIEATGGAQVGIHALDRRVLTNYEERVGVATKDLRVYLDRAGIPQEKRQTLIDMYSFGKRHFSSVNVDFILDEGIAFEGMQFIHAPGHCPGQMCIQIGDVLLSADHILSHTTPHQAPESITRYMGLGHYRDSLRHMLHLDGVRLTLGGHEAPIHDLHRRIEEILASHDRKINRVLDIVREAGKPLTIADITAAMYPDRHGYDELLALEEAGAHIEYLYERGYISVANLPEVEQEDNPPLQYSLS